jgi:hypothetical protein
MIRNLRYAVLALLLMIAWNPVCAEAAFSFRDTRFQNNYTTENLDKIIEEYELFDGWYWTTQAEIPQDFHGKPECPGWNTTVESKQPESLFERLVRLQMAD